MRLQKMKQRNGEELFIHVCAVNEISLGGEFTVCGCAIPDSSLDSEDFERVGAPFIGKLKDVTCPVCRREIAWFKSLK